jgi:predicted Zn-dependent peptidase
VLTTPVDGFVSWRGSFLAFPDLAAGEDLLQHLVVSLLDKGTEQRDRFALARVLEDRGASLRLSSDGLYVDVSGQALREDVPVVMEVLAEMLRSPSFTAEEFEKVRSQTLAKLQRQMERTGKQASGALSRRLFPENHPNYSAPPETQIECLKSLSLNDVKTYHERHFGSNDYTLCMVGDVELAEMQEAVASAFDEWPHHRASPTHSTDPAGQEPGHTSIALPDKSNTDVRMGHALPVRRDHDDYIALYVGNYILGGNFSARLMNEIRDERGLTYHIGSGLSGVSTRYAGSWTVEVTLSEDKIAEGIAATRDVIRTFVEEGATGDELEAKKTTITGAYTVGLATTQRLARSLLTNAERDFPAEYLDRFPKEVEALTLEEVNRAIRRYLKPEEMHTALAGTIPKKVEA